jgi:hypothetical protein
MSITKLQIPMDKRVRDGLERKARSYGFDSVQAYIRVWAKAEVDGRRLDFASKTVTLSADANKRYERMVAELESEKESGKAKKYTSVDHFMKDLQA